MGVRQLIQPVTSQQELFQKRFGSLGNKIPFRYTQDHKHEVDMRLSLVPSGSKRKGFEFTPLESERLVLRLTSATPPKLVQIIASPAQGKTREMFDLAHFVFAIYVEMNTEAEKDRDPAFADACKNIDQVGMDRKNKERTTTAHRIVQADIAARLLLLLTFLTVEQKAASPQTFLLIQLNTGNELVLSTRKQLVASAIDMTVLLEKVDSDVSALLLELSVQHQYCVCVDEAQVGVSLFGVDDFNKGRFAFSKISNESPSTLPDVGNLLYTYSSAVLQLTNCRTVVIAGTGYTATMSKSIFGSDEGPVTEPFHAPAMPFLSKRDILRRWNLLLHMPKIDTQEASFQSHLTNLTGRPRWSSSVIQSYLQQSIEAMGGATATEHLVAAMKKAFDAAKRSLHTLYTNYYSANNAQRSEILGMLKRIHAYYSVVPKNDNRHLVGAFFTDDELDRLVVAGLCHVVAHRDHGGVATEKAGPSSAAAPVSEEPSTEVTFSEPAMRSFVMAMGRLHSWSPEDAFTKWIFRSHAFEDLRRNTEFEYLCGLFLARKSKMTVGKFARSYLRNGKGVTAFADYDTLHPTKTVELPGWVDTTALKFTRFAMCRSRSSYDDIDHINSALNFEKEWQDVLMMPADVFRPDLLAINPTENLGVAVSIKLKNKNLDGQDKITDLLSTSVGGFNKNKDGTTLKGRGLPRHTKDKLSQLRWLRIHITIPNITVNRLGQHNVVVINDKNVVVNINETNYVTFFGEDSAASKALAKFMHV